MIDRMRLSFLLCFDLALDAQKGNVLHLFAMVLEMANMYSVFRSQIQTSTLM